MTATLEAAPGTATNRHFVMEIAGADFEFARHLTHDREVVGLQIAEAAGAHPEREFVILHHRPNGELETLRPTEPVDLGDGELHRFFVIKGSDLHRFTVAGLDMEWPLPSLRAWQIKFLGRAKEDEGLVQVTEHGHVAFDDDDAVALNPEGVEEFLLKETPKLVTVYYKHEPRELERRRWSTEELIDKFSVPDGYKLDLIGEDCTFVELKPGEKIKLKDGMEFTSHAPRGQSS